MPGHHHSGTGKSFLQKLLLEPSWEQPLSRILSATWVEVLASFSIEQSSAQCSSSRARFQGRHSANDLP